MAIKEFHDKGHGSKTNHGVVSFKRLMWGQLINLSQTPYVYNQHCLIRLKEERMSSPILSCTGTLAPCALFFPIARPLCFITKPEPLNCKHTLYITGQNGVKGFEIHIHMMILKHTWGFEVDDRSKCLVQVTLKLRGGFAPCMVTCDRLIGGARAIRKPMTTQTHGLFVSAEQRPC